MQGSIGCEKGAEAHNAGAGSAMSFASPRKLLLKPLMSLISPTAEGRTKAFKEDQADTKLSDFSRPVRTMVTSCWSVIGLPKM